MNFRRRYQDKWFSIFTFCLVTLGLLVYPAPSLYAQDAVNEEESTEPTTAVDDATFDWESYSVPFIEKSEESVTYPDDESPDDEKKAEQFSHSLFIPNLREAGNAESAAVHATWRVVMNETFEATFPAPNSLWSIRDYNGASVGVRLNQFATLVWDDNSTRAYSGTWSANPNDGAWAPQPGASPTYANHTDTWMRYGPFSLVGATDARLKFYYWLDSEFHYDTFSWEYSCMATPLSGWIDGNERSGPTRKWVGVTRSLKDCLGKSNVYIRFSFKSDYSNPTTSAPTGVWVDDIKIEKYQ